MRTPLIAGLLEERHKYEKIVRLAVKAKDIVFDDLGDAVLMRKYLDEFEGPEAQRVIDKV